MDTIRSTIRSVGAFIYELFFGGWGVIASDATESIANTQKIANAVLQGAQSPPETQPLDGERVAVQTTTFRGQIAQGLKEALLRKEGLISSREYSRELAARAVANAIICDCENICLTLTKDEFLALQTNCTDWQVVLSRLQINKHLDQRAGEIDSPNYALAKCVVEFIASKQEEIRSRGAAADAV